jgi:hypothetical protein
MTLQFTSGFLFLSLVILGLFYSCTEDEPDPPAVSMQLQTINIGTLSLNDANQNEFSVDRPVVLKFSNPLDVSTVPEAISILDSLNNQVELQIGYLDNQRTVSLQPVTALNFNSTYTLLVNEQLKGKEGEIFNGASFEFTTRLAELLLESILINDRDFTTIGRISKVEKPVKITAQFSRPLSADDLENLVSLRRDKNNNLIPLNITLENQNSTLIFEPAEPLEHISRYTFNLSNRLTSSDQGIFEGFSNSFYTAIDSTFKFPELSETELLNLVQEQTFKYFWDFAHPVSGLARERNTSGDLVTIGGSGFGVMAILVGIERGFISREAGIDRLEKIINFLSEADRFHGVWPHWMHGATGDVIPFSERDDGGDLVETSFMIQGLLTVRQYLDPADAREQTLIDQINQLWSEVEWDWYTKGENVLYWHWSPDFDWAMNLPIRGYNEALITYVLAASSPTHVISTEVYHQGWTNTDHFINGNTYYDYELPLGFPYGGPLFFAHYSFLGLDPRNLTDRYADYWRQNVNHTRINQAYVIDNPLNYVGYSNKVWGLTASDNQDGYSAHSPTNDLGVITPTAALSSMPFTPEESLETLKFFYYVLGDKLWGEYGFYDAFNFTEDWVADSYLAIDQGPIIIMIENYRSGLLWDLFMSASEVQTGLDKLDFS